MSTVTSFDAVKSRQIAFTTRLPALCSALTLVDNQPWTFDNTDSDGHTLYNSARLINGREVLYLGIDGYQRNGRINLSGGYGTLPDGRNWSPRDTMRDANDARITIAQTKTDLQIAKDICSRLLPVYRVWTAKFAEACLAQRTQLDTVETTLNAVIAAAHGKIAMPTPYQCEQMKRNHSIGVYVHGGGHLDISANSIKFDGYLSLDETLQVLQILAKRTPDAETEE